MTPQNDEPPLPSDSIPADAPVPGEPAVEPGMPLLPPRPNPGPEPMRDSSPSIGEMIAVGVVVTAVLLSAIVVSWRSRRHRRHRPRPVSTSNRSATALERAEDETLSDRDRIVAQAEAIREAMIATFGPVWAARTTEEVAASPELADRLGPDRTDRVVALLTIADRAKFAGAEGAEDIEIQAQGLDAGNGWVAEVIDALAAGARSSTTGK